MQTTMVFHILRIPQNKLLLFLILHDKEKFFGFWKIICLVWNAFVRERHLRASIIVKELQIRLNELRIRKILRKAGFESFVLDNCFRLESYNLSFSVEIKEKEIVLIDNDFNSFRFEKSEKGAEKLIDFVANRIS